MLTRHITPDGRMVRAYDRARTFGHNAWRIDTNTYTVKSETTADKYTIRVTPDGGLQCNCKAGQYGQPCKHAARVSMRLARRR